MHDWSHLSQVIAGGATDASGGMDPINGEEEAAEHYYDLPDDSEAKQRFKGAAHR